MAPGSASRLRTCPRNRAARRTRSIMAPPFKSELDIQPRGLDRGRIGAHGRRHRLGVGRFWSHSDCDSTFSAYSRSARRISDHALRARARSRSSTATA